ncbi:MAG: UDP-3-O-(3-hydroxymyristoyl)glucosamine N-acyltransferase [Acidobacteria bacterium]|nr:MAG: UDP-3-O-(3-hydroxymyristoyl)glucosamine N-acyltransferase [Acidobacteriota bacterium]
MTLQELAERLHCRLEGDPRIDVQRVASIERAEPGDLTFVANSKYQTHLSSTRASAVLVATAQVTKGLPVAILRTDDPYLAFARAVEILTPAALPPRGIDPLSSVAPDARLGRDVAVGVFASIGAGAIIGSRTVIYPGAVIGPGAVLGDDCVIHSHVSIRERVSLGHRVVVQDGAVIGSDGFGFVRQSDGSHLKIPQRAIVVIEDDVEIGANTTIDRPAVKIDNLVQIAHGVTVGRRTLLAAQVGIAGSTVLEEDVTLAGQVGIAGHLRIGKGVVATAQTGVPNSVDAGAVVSGYPAIANREWLKSSAVFRQLPALKKRVAELEQRIAELEEKLEACELPSKP